MAPNDTPEARAYPTRPFVGVGVVVWRGDEFLLVKRGKPPRLGEWSLPGGAQVTGETVADAARREVMEETGLDIAVGPVVDVVDSIRRDGDGSVNFHFTLVDVLAEWRAGEAVAADDAADAAWFRLDDVPGLGLWDETERIVRLSAQLRDAAGTGAKTDKG